MKLHEAVAEKLCAKGREVSISVLRNWRSKISSQHDGDCTRQCYTCARCLAEEIEKEITEVAAELQPILDAAVGLRKDSRWLLKVADSHEVPEGELDDAISKCSYAIDTFDLAVDGTIDGDDEEEGRDAEWTLVNACQLLDSWKDDETWTEHDTKIREGLTRMLLALRPRRSRD